MGSQTADKRSQDLEDTAARAKLGFWEYRERDARFHGSALVIEILGLAQGTVPLETVSALYAAESAGTLTRAIELALAEGNPFSLVSEIATPSGRRKWIRTQGHMDAAEDSESRRIVGTIQDISEIRLLDRITQESEMTLNQVEQISHIGHWSVSLTDGSIYHSDEIKRIFGYEPSEYALSVDEAIEAYHPDDRDEVIRLFNRAVETGQGYEFDLRIVQPSGDIRYVHSKGYTEQDGDGNVSRVYGVFQDVTERELAERALRESDVSMKALVDGVRTAIVVHGKDGEILLSNQMANRLLAPLATEVVGKELTDPAWRFVFEDETSVPVEELPVSRILRTREPIENLVLGRHDATGVAWLLVNGIPVFDKDEDLSKIVISFVNITDRKRMEERLRQSEKMKAIGQLAGGVAHDFNNQLMVMMNYAGLLERTLEAGSNERSYVDGILAGVSRSADLTKQLLAFAREGKYVVTTVDMNDLISDVVSMAGHSFDKKIRLTHHANAQPATIAGDLTQLQNALLNMALNSRDAMPAGGELVFSTDRVTLDEQSMASAALDIQPGECLRVTISDNGTGMDAATQKHIFEPFFTTKGQGKGTGMGMASVYGTVKNHHGAIALDSSPGEGTTITMHFPLDLSRSERPAEPVATPRETGGRILIVDDERAVAESMGMLLDLEGFETTVCENGRVALQEFEKSWKTIDLVLLDMIMPEMNGAETFHAMKEIDPTVKTVLLSGYSFTDEAKTIVEEGAAGFLLKPVTADELLQTICDLLAAGTTDA
jgi:PAS domain S-box-containing protein